MVTLAEKLRDYLCRPKVKARIRETGFPTDEVINTTVTIQMEYPLISDFTAEIVRFFRDSKGPNFVELAMVDPVNAQSYVLTVRPLDGMPAGSIIKIMRETLTRIAANDPDEFAASALAREALRVCRYLQPVDRPDDRQFRTPGLTKAACDRIYASIEESSRLEGLTATELIAEVIQAQIADHPAVIELMNRLYPGWQNDKEIEKAVRNETDS
ncbi:MAG: hypothetical protein L0220_05705 [Acidobacteria bacterium]|nr:hypothetical protein [Acidobacteriota bacterium]